MRAFLVLKVYFGVKTMCKKFHKVCLLGCDLARGPILRLSHSPSNAVTAVMMLKIDENLRQASSSHHQLIFGFVSEGICQTQPRLQILFEVVVELDK